MVIVIAGMIGLGKSSVAAVLGQHFNSEVFYESVDDNPILPLFYQSTEEEIQRKRYPFLLQLHFLNTRFKSIKKALTNNYNVLDRSIYEDAYFCKINKDLGRISEMEYELYQSLLGNMMEEIEEMPKKSPDLMIYLKGSFETVIERITKRGRGYEISPDLKDYYYTLWKDYDKWVEENYTASKVLTIDMDKMDIVANPNDLELLIELVEKELKDMI